ncbi:MAG: DMT family transporter [bacterium]
MPTNLPFLGESLALLCALFWALAVILFKKSGESVHPLGLNLFKNLLALILFIPTLKLFHQPLLPPLTIREYVLFIFSGILGMAIGDTLFFMTLNRIGAGLAAIVSYMYSPLIIALSLIFLKENLKPAQIVGTVLILIALFLTIRIKVPAGITRKTLLIGILLGIISTTATAAGIVMIKPSLAKTSLLWATAIRLFAGSIGVLFITILLPERKRILVSPLAYRSLGYTIGATILGTYLALTLWLGGMKFTLVSVAAPLNQLSNILIFILSALILKEPITSRRLVAIIIAFSGALLVFIR